MLVSDKDALVRLSSPNNLINRLRNGLSSAGSAGSAGRKNAMGLFVPQAAPEKQLANPTQEIVKTPVKTAEWNPFTASEVEVTLRERLNSSIPQVIEPTSDDILDNADGKIKITQAHDDALNVLSKALTALSTKIDDVKPERLPNIIQAAMKTVESIRKEKMELFKERQGREVHFHFYEPERRQIKDYDVIDVG